MLHGVLYPKVHVNGIEKEKEKKNIGRVLVAYKFTNALLATPANCAAPVTSSSVMSTGWFTTKIFYGILKRRESSDVIYTALYTS